MNLVVNARDAMADGGVLTLDTANLDLSPPHAATLDLPPGRYVVLAVTDTGVGMSPDTRAHVFEPFFTTKDRAKGTCLGLSTVHGIVTQSGGQAVVQSAPGQGSTFTIYLPRVAAPQAIENEAKRVASAPLGGSETILIAEDDDQVRNVLQAILRRHGYAVLCARDAAEALELCLQRSQAIDLLLTDVIMPRVNGFELAEQITGMRAGIKVVYMSGYTDHSMLRRRWDKAGATFLHKPIAAELLLRTIRAALNRSDEASSARTSGS